MIYPNISSRNISTSAVPHPLLQVQTRIDVGNPIWNTLHNMPRARTRANGEGPLYVGALDNGGTLISVSGQKSLLFEKDDRVLIELDRSGPDQILIPGLRISPEQIQVFPWPLRLARTITLDDTQGAVSIRFQYGNLQSSEGWSPRLRKPLPPPVVAEALANELVHEISCLISRAKEVQQTSYPPSVLAIDFTDTAAELSAVMHLYAGWIEHCLQETILQVSLGAITIYPGSGRQPQPYTLVFRQNNPGGDASALSKVLDKTLSKSHGIALHNSLRPVWLRTNPAKKRLAVERPQAGWALSNHDLLRAADLFGLLHRETCPAVD